jgi:hypothetical protein
MGARSSSSDRTALSCECVLVCCQVWASCWEQHAQLRYSRKLPETLLAEDCAAAAAGGASANAGAAAAGAAGSSGVRRAAKRPRTAAEAEDGGEG